MNNNTSPSGRIAIIGMSGRFPGADDVATLWQNLCAGRDALRSYTPDEIRASIDAHDYLTIPYLERQVGSGNWVGKGYFLNDADKFDAGFFGYPPSEAELLDPQQRIFLESAWAALEDAGYVPNDYPGSVGVFAGTGLSRYFLNNVFANREIMCASERDLIAGIGNEPDYLTNRVAFKLNLTGPSVTIQTACSTSLVAIHLACQALRNGECDAALAGGALAVVPNGLGYQYTDGSMNSPDGRIRAFDAGAQGTVFAEGGVGVIVLKRLEDAERDEDFIYAVIRGSAVTNDGNHKAGYTAPGIPGQVNVISRALAAANVNPAEISYVEAHGTGTALGDPIEITALTQAFRQGGAADGQCAIGSLKTNIGHLAPAAGVAGVIKAALCAHHRLLPPSLNYEAPNPRIDFAQSPFYVNTAATPWQPPAGGPRIAAVSSFGIGGTNAHLILEEAPETLPTESADKLRSFLVSAKTPGALGRSAARLADYLEQHPAADLDDVALTLQEGRRAFEIRAAVVGRERAEILPALRRLAEAPPRDGILPAGRKLALLFTGQGAQYPGMARELHAGCADFRAAFDQCWALLRPHLDLAALLLGDPARADEAAHATLRETRHAQPALFIVEYAMARQLAAWGIVPAALLGHSLGEYVAATLAGVFTLEDALALVALRGRLMQGMAPGAMLSIAADEAAVLPWLSAEIQLAAVNSPRATVVAGPAPAIEALAARLTEAGLSCRPLQTSHAFHSAMMQPLAARFRAAVASVPLQPPEVPLVSNLTGTWLSAEQACDPDYWVRHLLSPVRFQAGLQTLLADGCGYLVEAGPGGVLSAFARQQPGNQRQAVAVPLLRHPQDTTPGDRYLRQGIGELWAAGYPVDYAAVEGDNQGRRIPLPTYPFARERHWLDAPKASEGQAGGAALRRSDDLGQWFHAVSWHRQPWLPAQPQLEGRRVLILESDTPHGHVLGAELTAALVPAGAHVTRAMPGDAFADLGEGRYRLRPGVAEDWETLARAAGRPTLVLHTWLLEPTGGDTLANAAGTRQLGFHALLALTQTLADEAGGPDENRLCVLSVASELFDVLPGEPLDAVKATVLGAHLAIGHEYRRLPSRALDLPPTLAANPPQAVPLILAELARLAAEPQAPLVLPDKCIAWRRGTRWVAQPETAAVPAPASPLQLAPDDTWLITGGLGGIGLEFAEALAAHGVRRLALTARNPLPERSRWEAWLAEHPADDLTAQRLRAVLRLEALGAEVLVPAGDVSRPDEVAAMVRQVVGHFGAIHGVIHAAGIGGGGVMALKTPAQADAVLAPKLLGALALEHALGGQPLRHFVLVSSLFAVLGGIGQVDYAAANSFLDAFARSRAERGLPTVSLAYGGWREVGMAVKLGHTKAPSAPPLPAGRTLSHPFLFSRDETAVAGEFRCNCQLRAGDHWAINEHRINGQPVMPGTGLVETLRAAAELVTGQPHATIAELYFYRPLFVPEDALVSTTVTLRALAAGAYDAEIATADGPVLSARIEPPAARPESVDVAALRVRCAGETLDFGEGQAALLTDAGFLSLGAHWQVVRRLHLGACRTLDRRTAKAGRAVAFSPDFRYVVPLRASNPAKNRLAPPLSRLRRPKSDRLLGHREMLGELALPEALRNNPDPFGLHPALLDMATGPITGHLLSRLDLGLTDEYLPYGYGRLTIHAPLPAELVTHVRYRGLSDDRDTVHLDIALYDPDGHPLAQVDNFQLRRVPAHALATPPKAQPLPLIDDGSISPAEGREALLRVLALGPAAGTHWIFNPHPLDALLRRMRAERIAEASRGETRKAKVVREDVVAAPPTTPTEEILVAIIEEALGITPVGIHDNFFDLGIDSVIGIQVVAHAKRHGVLVRPNQLFEHQTVAALAAVAVANGEVAVEGGGAGAAMPESATATAAPAAPLPGVDLGAVLDALGEGE